MATYEAEERELEYKHRHIFVGTASLDDFLEILEVGPTYTTTKRQVAKAFGRFLPEAYLNANNILTCNTRNPSLH